MGRTPKYEYRPASEYQRFVGQVVTTRHSLLDMLTTAIDCAKSRAHGEIAVRIYLDRSNCVRDVRDSSGALSLLPPERVISHAGAGGSIAVVYSRGYAPLIPTEADVEYAASLHLLASRSGSRLLEYYVWCVGGYKSVLNTRRFKALVASI